MVTCSKCPADCYIVSSGILTTDEEGYTCVNQEHDRHESARRVLAFAADMLRCSKLVSCARNAVKISATSYIRVP